MKSPRQKEKNSYLEGKRVGLLTQLLNQPFLEPGQRFLLLGDWREGLDVGDKEILAECQSQDIQVLAAIAEGASQCHKNWGGKEWQGVKFT